MSQDSDVDPFLQLAIDSQITQYAAVASVTIMAFDCLISLRREVEMVWRRPKSLVKWLYIWNRYFALLMTAVCTSVYLRQTPSDKRCFIYQRVQGTSATIIIGTVDIILLLRVWILCERSRRIMYVLLGMITVEIVTMLCVTTIAVDTLTEYAHVGFIKGCYAQDVPRYFSVFPIPSFIVSCSMFFVTVRNCIRRIAVSRPYITHSIAMVFLRDGIVWFLVISLLAPPQIALWAWGRQTLIQLLMMPSLAAYSLIGAKVLLNMMEIAAEGSVPQGIEL